MSRRAEALFDSTVLVRKPPKTDSLYHPRLQAQNTPFPPRNTPSNMVKNSPRAASACEKTESHKERPFPHAQWVVKKPV